jgi:hypothetical protein
MESSKYKSVYTEAARLEKLCAEQSTALAAKEKRIAELEAAITPLLDYIHAHPREFADIGKAWYEAYGALHGTAEATLSQKGGE